MNDHTKSIDPQSSPPTVLFGDFSCPFSALAHRRAMRLAAQGSAHVVWRPVEHDPDVPVDGSPIDDESRAAFEAELDQIRELLADDETDDLRVPSRKLNTAALNRQFASLPPDRRDEFAEAVFDAYWRAGRDPETDDDVERLTAPVTADGERAADEWQHEWEGFERRIVPMMQLPEGKLSRGLGTLARLQ